MAYNPGYSSDPPSSDPSVHYHLYGLAPTSPEAGPQADGDHDSGGGTEASNLKSQVADSDEESANTASVLGKRRRSNRDEFEYLASREDVADATFRMEVRLRKRIACLQDEVLQLRAKHYRLCAAIDAVVAGELRTLQRNVWFICKHLGIQEHKNMGLEALLKIADYEPPSLEEIEAERVLEGPYREGYD
ncbi:hypothetical protein OH76DRAFT_1490201 [Lentinus brumalis]|uniref:Uncharacterized protein n=1 Tax=Lentinus brumalis TaxID=2498619 RepID=A0A371CJR9_9APHY|nr:hypothetical protein OH76DRAFT_1490201 [Polyporus brumalis]